MKRTNIIWMALMSVLLLSITGCQKKRISYTDMIKRENKEIKAFMDKEGFTVLSHMPERVLAANEFVKIEEGVYLNIIERGDMITEDEVTLITRFSVNSIGDRQKFSFSSTGPESGSTYPLPFKYLKNSDMPLADPNASVNESANNIYLCAAMSDALKYVGFGSKIRMIVSFRKGPGFTSENGIALFFDDMTFNRKP